MKRIFIENSLSRRFRRSQRGQSILLMAFAFIALIAFVGLVTDVALLFVRYAALRRAVDSAAIAAAGQIREGTDYGVVAVSAEQYLRLHNVDPQTITVETCETDIYQWRQGLGPWEGNPHPEATYPKVTESMPTTELCDWVDPKKLVRVSAQIESPTTFLSLIGIGSITLEATSVSETAVLDVALVIDISESMSKETTPQDYYDLAKLNVPGGGAATNVMRTECYTTAADYSDTQFLPYARERWAGCCNDPGVGLVSDGTIVKTSGGVLPNGYIWHDSNSNGKYDGSTEDGVQSNTRTTSLTDPDGFNFTTLICSPFKDVKDAARLFIKRLDFVRGDRVVLVTFDRSGVAYDPDGTNTDFRPMIRSEQVAVDTLNLKIGVNINQNTKQIWNLCQWHTDAKAAWDTWLNDTTGTVPQPSIRPYAYESVSACGNTNIGGGILAANNALTDPVDIRREAVWVMVVLSDGAANVTNSANGAVSPTDYGYWGYCPWWTFCFLQEKNADGTDFPYHWGECTENDSQTEMAAPICNDNDPVSRHFCIDWTTGEPETGNAECSQIGHYDADDYARDMADFAGLIEVTPGGKQGNFIAMFSIAFGDETVDDPTAAPLLRYIADAGDNGFIDNNLQQDLREDRITVPTYPIGGPYPSDYGDPDVCEGDLPATQQCGQYYYAAGLQELNDVFKEIASRLFTRLAR